MPHSSLQSRSSVTPVAQVQTPALPQAAVDALRRGQVIDAITLVRVELHVDLQEATSSVDAYLRAQPALKNRIEHAQADAREGLLRWVLFLVIGGVGLAYVLM